MVEEPRIGASEIAGPEEDVAELLTQWTGEVEAARRRYYRIVEKSEAAATCDGSGQLQILEQRHRRKSTDRAKDLTSNEHPTISKTEEGRSKAGAEAVEAQ